MSRFTKFFTPKPTLQSRANALARKQPPNPHAPFELTTPRRVLSFKKRPVKKANVISKPKTSVTATTSKVITSKSSIIAATPKKPVVADVVSCADASKDAISKSTTAAGAIKKPTVANVVFCPAALKATTSQSIAVVQCQEKAVTVIQYQEDDFAAVSPQETGVAYVVLCPATQKTTTSTFIADVTSQNIVAAVVLTATDVPSFSQVLPASDVTAEGKVAAEITTQDKVAAKVSTVAAVPTVAEVPTASDVPPAADVTPQDIVPAEVLPASDVTPASAITPQDKVASDVTPQDIAAAKVPTAVDVSPASGLSLASDITSQDKIDADITPLKSITSEDQTCSDDLKATKESNQPVFQSKESSKSMVIADTSAKSVVESVLHVENSAKTDSPQGKSTKFIVNPEQHVSSANPTSSLISPKTSGGLALRISQLEKYFESGASPAKSNKSVTAAKEVVVDVAPQNSFISENQSCIDAAKITEGFNQQAVQSRESDNSAFHFEKSSKVIVHPEKNDSSANLQSFLTPPKATGKLALRIAQLEKYFDPAVCTEKTAKSVATQGELVADVSLQEEAVDVLLHEEGTDVLPQYDVADGSLQKEVGDVSLQEEFANPFTNKELAELLFQYEYGDVLPQSDVVTDMESSSAAPKRFKRYYLKDIIAEEEAYQASRDAFREPPRPNFVDIKKDYPNI